MDFRSLLEWLGDNESKIGFDVDIDFSDVRIDDVQSVFPFSLRRLRKNELPDLVESKFLFFISLTKIFFMKQTFTCVERDDHVHIISFSDQETTAHAEVLGLASQIGTKLESSSSQ